MDLVHITEPQAPSVETNSAKQASAPSLALTKTHARQTKNILVRLKVFNNRYFAFLDSGSEISLIKKSVADMLSREFQLKVSKSDLRVWSINKDPIAIRGILNVPFKFGRTTVYNKFYIAEDVGFTGAFLLGIDFLNKANAIIQCGDKNKVTLHNVVYSFRDIKHANAHVSVEAVKGNESSNIGSICSLELAKNCIIAPFSISVVKANVQNFFENNSYMIEHAIHDSLDMPFLRVARCLVQPNKKGNCLIQCINASYKTIKLKTDTKVATANSV